MSPTKEQLNRFITEKVLGWESYSKVSIHPEWFSNDGCEGLVGEEDFFNPGGLAMVLDALEKNESITKVLLLWKDKHWCGMVQVWDGTNYVDYDNNRYRALFTAFYHAFGGE